MSEAIVVSQLLSLPAAKLTRTALVIDDKATDQQLAQIGHALSSIDGSRCWWIGDYACVIQKRKGDAYTEGRAEALQIEPNTFHHYKATAAFFPACSRLQELSFAHHAESMAGGGNDLGAALKWLGVAKEKGWSVSELRHAIRTERAEYKHDGRQPTGNGYSIWLDAERWASIHFDEFKTYEPVRAVAILSDIPKLTAAVDTLREVASKYNSAETAGA